jgi:tetratricopeptide (TPR) repeat protein
VPHDAPTHTYLGLALAYLGRRADAIREGERAVELMSNIKNASLRADLQHTLAWIYMLVGEQERALDTVEPLLKLRYYFSPGWLRINPNFAPLRGNPRFARLVQGQ